MDHFQATRSDESDHDLGACCACSSLDARNIVLLEYEGPPGFSGWGCFVCSLEQRGAMAVVCDYCIETDANLKHVIGGRYILEGARIPLEGYKIVPFKHDESKHRNQT